MRIPVASTHAPAAIGPYSQAMRASGDLLFLSGQIALKPSGELVLGDVKEQTRQVMTNILALLSAADLHFADIVKTTIYLSSMDHFQAVNEVYGSYFASAPPARSTVAVRGLPRGVDVEIETIAVCSKA